MHDPRPHLGEIEHHADKNSDRRYAKWIDEANEVIVHGRKMVHYIKEDHGLDLANIHYVPLGFPKHNESSKIKINSDRKPSTVLFFGRIWEYKGLDYLIRAEPIISAQIPNLEIVIAGERRF